MTTEKQIQQLFGDFSTSENIAENIGAQETVLIFKREIRNRH